MTGERRSARQAERSTVMPAPKAQASASASASSSQREGIDRRRTFAPPAPESSEEKIQTLLKLPGFSWEKDLHWVFPRDNRHILRMLGVEVPNGATSWRPADNQQMCTARIADMIESCNDEWLDNWQECAMTAGFWEAANERLLCLNRWWSHMAPNSQHVYKIVMTYAARWDAKGQGFVRNGDEWGFRLGELTWGDRKAEIDPGWFAKPWNAASDFFEYCNDTEKDYGPIQPPKRMNKIAAARYAGSLGRLATQNAITVYGPHHGDDIIAHSNTSEASVKACRSKPTVARDLSDPGRLMVIFRGLDLRGKGVEQETDRFSDNAQEDLNISMHDEGVLASSWPRPNKPTEHTILYPTPRQGQVNQEYCVLTDKNSYLKGKVTLSDLH